MDEDLERTTFIVGTGVIGPMDIVSIVISTTLELPTLENGAIRIIYPTLLTPIVTGQMTSSKSENGGKSEENGYSCLNSLWHHCFQAILVSHSCIKFDNYRITCNILLFYRPTSCFGATSGKQDRVMDSEQPCAHSIFNRPAANLAPYELNFQLLVRGACLLAGTVFLFRYLVFKRFLEHYIAT